ncbi:unnamed protein product [Cercospora beticola]|nr:unnamed protein product [Cercospora beticola]
MKNPCCLVALFLLILQHLAHTYPGTCTCTCTRPCTALHYTTLACSDDTPSPDSNKTSTGTVQPLNIPPSRARRTLAARLAQKNQDKTLDNDPDAADASAVEIASTLPEEPLELSNSPEQSDSTKSLDGLQITGLRTVSGAGHVSRASGSKFSGLFSSSDSDSDNDSDDDSSIDEDDAGRDHTLTRDGGDYDDPGPSPSNSSRRLDTASSSSTKRRPSRRERRPSTTEAQVRKPLDDDSDEDSEDVNLDLEIGDLPESVERKLVLDSAANSGAASPFGDLPRGLHDDGLDDDDDDDDDDDSSEDDLVEIRPRRTS